MNILPSLRVLIIAVLVAAVSATAGVIHVAKPGSLDGTGTAAKPFATIGQAAAVALPGDTVLVHGGVFREWVRPPRGGLSESKRITYLAAPGEDVTVCGSERIVGWRKIVGGEWMAEIHKSLFGAFNPYAVNVSGDYLTYGQWHHLGDLYVDDSAYTEVAGAAELSAGAKRWRCDITGDTTRIWANFGTLNPNERNTEINVREMVFSPAMPNLSYISIIGFTVKHGAPNWAQPKALDQTGMIWVRGGHHWEIRNCRIVHSRCVGVSIGLANGADTSSIERMGHHRIVRNHIRRCGQAGIAGKRLNAVSEIEENYIEETNYRDEFGGWEVAGIKVHRSVDISIKGNFIRGVKGRDGAFGMWIDFGNQGGRISGNVITHAAKQAFYLEANHGPLLLDNNVVLDCGYRSVYSEATVAVHNLFVNALTEWDRGTETRTPPMWIPHTCVAAGLPVPFQRDDKWLNNVFIQRGCSPVSTPGYVIDYNVYYQGARKSYSDPHSVVDAFTTGVETSWKNDAFTIGFSVNDAPFSVQTPLITRSFIGTFAKPNQGIENHDGSPITVNTDFFGTPRNAGRPMPGPFEKLNKGQNRFSLFSLSKVGPAPREPVATVSGARPALRLASKVSRMARPTSWFDLRGRKIRGATATGGRSGLPVEGVIVIGRQ